MREVVRVKSRGGVRVQGVCKDGGGAPVVLNIVRRFGLHYTIPALD